MEKKFQGNDVAKCIANYATLLRLHEDIEANRFMSTNAHEKCV